MGTTTVGSRRKAAIVGALTGLMGYGTIQYRRNNRRAAIAALRDAVEPPRTPRPHRRHGDSAGGRPGTRLGPPPPRSAPSLTASDHAEALASGRPAGPPRPLLLTTATDQRQDVTR